MYLQSQGASYATVGIVLSALSLGRLFASLPSAGLHVHACHHDCWVWFDDFVIDPYGFC